MHRLVIALTTLLTLVGGTVVAGYLIFFSASTDRAAAVVPAGTPIYVNIYLQPSSAQKMNLAALLAKLPGFADQATLDAKIDEVAQNLLGNTGLDYRRDLKPWLGNQLAAGVTPNGTDASAARTLVVAEVKDRAAADAALGRLAAEANAQPTVEAYRDVQVVTGGTETHAFLDDGRLLVIGTDAGDVKRAIDAHAGAAEAIGDEPEFRKVMATLPPDHLASAYLDLRRLADATGGSASVGGFSTMAAALVAEQAGLHLVGQLPFAATEGSASASAMLPTTDEPGELSGWMPDGTQAEATIFGLRRLLEQAEAQVGKTPGAESAAQAIAQLRALVAFGLGLSIDDDVLPLLDHETALGLSGLETTTPHGQLLLRPNDPAAARTALDRIRDALRGRGATVTSEQAAGSEVTTITVPETGSLSYTMADDVIVIGLTPDDVTDAIDAHAAGSTLSADDAYRHAFDVAGGRQGNELFVNVAALLDATGVNASLPADARDILQHVTGLAVSMPAHQDRFEFHAVATIE